MNKKVAIIMTKMVEEIEFTSPAKAIEEAGFSYEVIAPTMDEIKGKNGETFTPDKEIGDADASEYDALLIPGGFSPDILRADKKGRFGTFAKHFMETSKPTFAICHGPQVLIDTDLLKDRNLTAFISIRKDLENAGAIVHDKSVIVCDNLVTSRTPDDLDDFNKELKKLLKSYA